MPSLTLKNVGEALLKRLRERARRDRRSVTQEALYLIERALSERHGVSGQSAAWRDLAGKWQSSRPVEEEIDEIYQGRTPGRDVAL